MIAVPVSNDAMIDLLQAGDFKRNVGDSSGIAITGKARVDEQRLTSRRHDQSCGAAFNVNEVDVESLWNGARRGLASKK